MTPAPREDPIRGATTEIVKQLTELDLLSQLTVVGLADKIPDLTRILTEIEKPTTTFRSSENNRLAIAHLSWAEDVRDVVHDFIDYEDKSDEDGSGRRKNRRELARDMRATVRGALAHFLKALNG